MNLREMIARSPALGLGFGVVAILIAVYVLWPRSVVMPTQSFFTSDDGKTFYREDATLVPPYNVDGKIAVRANVYRCPVCGKQFVGTMERYKPDRVEAIRKDMAEAREQVEAVANGATDLPPAPSGPMPSDFETKRPGESESAWHVLAAGPTAVSASQMEAAMSGATLIRCSEHPDTVAEPVMP